MKRSEMVKLMIEADANQSTTISLHHMFSNILDEMEKAGMLPPPKDKVFPCGNQKSLDKQGIKRMVADYTCISLWESEDE